MNLKKYVLLLVLLLILGTLIVAVVLNCLVPTIPIHLALRKYFKMTAAELPEDLHLTIYFVDPNLLTRYPWGVDELVSADGVRIVNVSYEQLANHSASLGKVDASVLQPSKENGYLNVRLYYVFETDRGPLLDVAISEIGGNVFVNGVEVQHNPAFYDIIEPFLTESDLQMLGI